MMTLITLIFIAPFALATIWIAILLTERCLTLIDKMREILKTTAMDGIQVWTSGNMSGIDIERERSKNLLAQEFGQTKLNEYQILARYKLIERRRELQSGEVSK